MEELQVCQDERDIPKQKLHFHLDRWTIDKIMFRNMAAKAARELRLKEAELKYETAQRDMRLGSEQQQLLLLKLKLDSAVEDIEQKDVQLLALKSQLQEERKWEHSVTIKVQEMTANFSKKAEKKVYRLQKLLDDWAASHKGKVSQIESKQALAITQLKEEIEHLDSRDEDMKAQQIQRSIEKKQLQVLARERDDLQAEQEKWHNDREQLLTVLQEREGLRRELEKRNLQQKEMEGVKDERYRLIADRHRFIYREEEKEELLTDRYRLSAQLEHLLAHTENIEGVVKERETLKHELDLRNSHPQEEVKNLIRERDFLKSQMKLLDEDYGQRVKKMAEQSQQDRREIQRLSCDLKGAEASHNELLAETTILKLEVKQVGDRANDRQLASAAELRELELKLEKLKEEKLTLIADAEKRDARLLELISRKEALEGPFAFTYPDQGAATNADNVKEGPEVLNAGDGHVLDHDMLESQIDQAAQVHRNDKKKSAKLVEDLRRENDNLRRETENLRELYAELEDGQRKKHQKPAKVAHKGSHRDPTSRNLELKLEAAGICCPSNEIPIADGNLREKDRDPSKQKLGSGTNALQKKRKGRYSKSGPEETRSTRSSAHVEVTKQNDRSSKIVFAPSPKNLRRKSQVDYSDSKFSAPKIVLKKNDIPTLKKRKKTCIEDDDLSQNERPPLDTLLHNLRSRTNQLFGHHLQARINCPSPKRRHSRDRRLKPVQ